MATRLLSVGIDAHDPIGLARWWADALGWTVTSAAADGAVVEPRPDTHRQGQPEDQVEGEGEGEGLFLVFLTVPEPKAMKNRVHLDLASEDLEAQATTVARLLAAGARSVDIGQRGVPWVVLADPEGNEFCILDPRERYRGAGPLAAVVVDAADPSSLARFWADATGWSVGDEVEGVTSLHHPSDRPPDLDFVTVADAKRVKNRVHLDVVAPGAERVAEEASRLIGLGAHPVDVGQGDVAWVVLADLEGNELCVVPPDL